MGLFLSKALLDLMGGHISVQSEPNVGTVFIFDVLCTRLPDNTPIDVDDDVRAERPIVSSTQSIQPSQPTPSTPLQILGA